MTEAETHKWKQELLRLVELKNPAIHISLLIEKLLEQSKYEKDVLESAENNHIWLNAMACINPTDSILKHIGEMVIAMLNNDENLILSDFYGSSFEKLEMKELIVRINKS